MSNSRTIVVPTTPPPPDGYVVAYQASSNQYVALSPSVVFNSVNISPNFGQQTVTGGAFAVNNGTNAPTITSGSGTPTSTPPNGSLYMRTDGTTITGLYIFEGGAWAPLGTGGGGGGGSSVPVPVELGFVAGTYTNTSGATPLALGRRRIYLSLFPTSVTVSGQTYTRVIRFYADVDGVAGNTTVELFDQTASEVVANTILVTNSTTLTELNSGPLTVGTAANNLKDTNAYTANIFNSASNNTTINNARLVISYELVNNPVAPDANTLIYYPLDAASVSTPSSIINWYDQFDLTNANNTLLSLASGASVNNPAGVYGTCLDFSANTGNGGVNTANCHAADSITNAITASCWVYINSYTTNSAVFFDKIYSSTGAWVAPFVSVGMELNSGGTGTWNGTITVSATAHVVTSAATIPLNTWTFLALTYDGTTIKLYTNGVQDANTGTISGVVDWTGVGGPGNYTVTVGSDTAFLPYTTIASGSAGMSLPQSTIYVASVSGFDTAGVIGITSSGGVQMITYTSVTGGATPSLNGCSGGTGSLSLGGNVQMIDSGNHCDDCAGPTVNFPNGFSTKLYDTTFTSWVPESDGNIQFNSTSGTYSPVALPYSGFNYAICFYWVDMDNSSGGTTPPFSTTGGGYAFYWSLGGTSPNRVAHLTSYNKTYSGGVSNVIEVRMHEGSANFEIIYGAIGGSMPSAVIGVQRDTGSLYTNYPSAGLTTYPGTGTKLSFIAHTGPGTAGGPFTIGGNPNNSAGSPPYQRLNGRVDDVRVENTVRSAAYLLAQFQTKVF